jgi:peptidyl-prolyl cis-trans isomerase C
MSKQSVIVATAALATGLFVGLALPRPWQRPLRAIADGATVAKFDGGALGANDVAKRAALQPPGARGMLAAPAQRKAFVENLVKFEMLAQEALRKGYDKDPQFIQDSKQRLGRILLEKDVEAPLKAKAPTDDDLKRFFKQNRSALSRPERIRIAAISLAAPEGDVLARATKREAAKAALAEVKRRAKDYYGFGEVAHARTEDAAARASNGELPFMSFAELAARYGEPLATAAFALKQPGELHDGVVETHVGYHVVKLIGREAAYEPRFEDVKESIRQRMVSEARADALKKYLDDLWKRSDVRIDEKALQAAKLD